MLAAWALSFAALGRRRVHFEHLIWMLLPIDMYGVQLAGFTLKPYMLFSAVLFQIIEEMDVIRTFFKNDLLTIAP